MKRNILILVFLLLLLPIEAHALERNGCINVTVLYNEAAVPGGEMTLYPVGSSAIHIGEGDDWEKNSQEMARELAENTEYFDGTTQTLDSRGRTAFRHLDEGVYLLVQTKAADGYQAANPFLVTLSDGETVTAYPKVEPVSIEEPDATPTPTPTLTPTPTPGATPTPVPPGQGTVTPAPSPSQEPSGITEPEVSPEPSTQVSPEPSQQPGPDVSPGVIEPEVSPEPTEITVVSPEPSEITAVSPEPSVSPTISPEPSPTASGEKKTLTNPFTGDEIDLRFSMALVGACLIALALVLLTGKRNKHS
jgi:hypothetical protein